MSAALRRLGPRATVKLGTKPSGPASDFTWRLRPLGGRRHPSVPRSRLDNNQATKETSESSKIGYLVNPLERVVSHIQDDGSKRERRRPTISPILVRDACQCPSCIDASDKQRNFSYSDIPSQISYKNVQYAEFSADVQVQWENDVPSSPPDHRTIISNEAISNLGKQFRNRHWDLYKRPQTLWNRDTYQKETARVDFNDYMTHTASLAEALHLLWRDGLVFIDGVPESEDSVSQIVNRIGPLQQTFYGPTWDVRSVPNAKNVAYTSKHLGFHMDLLYMRDPPGFQFLHCVHNSAQGGESRFADTFNVLDQHFASNGRKHFPTLCHQLVRYEYDNDGFFYSDAKPTIQTTDSLGVPPRNVTNARSAELADGKVAHVFWSPPFVGHIPSSSPHQELMRFVNASKALSDIMEQPENVVEEKMDSGTCVIFDNLRVVHARNAFDMNSGKRWLRGAYLNRQDFVSKAVSVMKDMPESITVTMDSASMKSNLITELLGAFESQEHPWKSNLDAIQDVAKEIIQGATISDPKHIHIHIGTVTLDEGQKSYHERVERMRRAKDAEKLRAAAADVVQNLVKYHEALAKTALAKVNGEHLPYSTSPKRCARDFHDGLEVLDNITKRLEMEVPATKPHGMR
ncbi:hypothetical protein LTS15_000751 [Exophiala xenobiotica]|nr:hypothetical protein LTS15_000751 [Exophiala xenobiotica]